MHKQLNVLKFGCDRTCPLYERRDWCRFNELFEMAGVSADVNSHTVTVKVAYDDHDALRKSVEAMGGVWHGQGSQRFYDRSTHEGMLFNLPGWDYGIVLKEDGSLKFDDYGGKWGDPEDIPRLGVEYTRQRVRTAADQLGWTHYELGDDYVVEHPGGGQIHVKPTGAMEGDGFVGQACHEPMTQLATMVGDIKNMVPSEHYYEDEVESHIEGDPDA